MQRKRNLHALLVGLQIGTATMKNSKEAPQKKNHQQGKETTIQVGKYICKLHLL